MGFAGWFILVLLGCVLAPNLTGACVSLAVLFWIAAILNSVFRFAR